MKKDLYAVFDKLAVSSGDPFTAPNLEVAKRHFGFTISKMPSVAKDCQLLHVGSYDDETCLVYILDDKPYVVYDYDSLMEDLKKNES